MSENKENKMIDYTFMREVVEFIEGTRKYHYLDPDAKDIAEMYKMEGTMNEIDKLVSEVIEVTNLNGEIIRWSLDTRPNEELTSHAILQRARKAQEIRKHILTTTASYINRIEQLNVNIVPKGASQDSTHFVSHWFKEHQSFKLDGYENIDVYVRNREGKEQHFCSRFCRYDSVRFEDYWYDHAHSMREVTKYIELMLDQVDEIYQVVSLIDSSSGEFFRRKDLLRKLALHEYDLSSLIQFDFDSASVWSARYSYYCSKTQASKIIEVRLQEKVESRGYVAFFTEHVNKKTGQIYSRELPTLLVNEVDGVKGPGGLVRLLWRDKGKTIIGRNPVIIHKQQDALSDLMGFLNKIYKPEQVLPMLKYMDREYISRITTQLHGVTQSQLYWISNETSVKKIMAKAYGKSGVDGLTKHAFGGFNNIDTIDKLMTVLTFTRAFKSFKPQFFEKITVRNNGYREWNYTHLDFTGRCSIKDIQDYIKYFYTRAFEEEMSSPDLTNWTFTEIALAVKNFKRIRSTKMRTAIRQHVKRSNFDLSQTGDFIAEELRKLGNAGLKMKTKYDEYNNRKIDKSIKVIMPKTGADLIEWGATQNNCIGSYVYDVYDGDCSIFGFKDEQNEWIGHLQISKSGNLQQLLGKHNSPIDIENYHKIIKWLKSIGVNTYGDFWGKQ
jgi:hypothetical protein